MARLSFRSFDEEIDDLERRIAADRIELARSVTDCKDSIRSLLTSPKALLTLTAVGFGAGKLIFGKSHKKQDDKPVSRGGLIGLALGLVGALVQPRLGIGSLVSLAGHYLRKRREAARVSSLPASSSPVSATGRSPDRPPSTVAGPAHSSPV